MPLTKNRSFSPHTITFCFLPFLSRFSRALLQAATCLIWFSFVFYCHSRIPDTIQHKLCMSMKSAPRASSLENRSHLLLQYMIIAAIRSTRVSRTLSVHIVDWFVNEAHSLKLPTLSVFYSPFSLPVSSFRFLFWDDQLRSLYIVHTSLLFLSRVRWMYSTAAPSTFWEQLDTVIYLPQCLLFWLSFSLSLLSCLLFHFHLSLFDRSRRINTRSQS